MEAANNNRPFEGAALAEVLHELAMINVKAGSLKMDVEPPSPEDAAAGAEPLTTEQIQEELEHIMQIVTDIVINHLKAAPSEWHAANDEIE